MASLEPVASPPPPYSPRRHERDGNRTDSPRNLQGTVSPSDTVSPATDPSQYGTPVSAATTISPDLPVNYGSHRSPPPTGTPRAANSSARASTTSDFPPPPPANSMTGSRQCLRVLLNRQVPLIPCKQPPLRLLHKLRNSTQNCRPGHQHREEQRLPGV
ncbi:MAG: hypothetical protein Q9210_004644 [Variospora velana]